MFSYQYEEKYCKHKVNARFKPIQYYINDEGCWICTSHLVNHDGYFSVNRNGRMQRLHRYVYEDTYNVTIPDGLVAMHKCDNRQCFNPEHLTLGTHADNAKDRNDKNRQAYGEKNGRAKLKESDIVNIKNDNRPFTVIAKDYNIDRKQISRIKHNKAWKHMET